MESERLAGQSHGWSAARTLACKRPEPRAETKEARLGRAGGGTTGARRRRLERRVAAGQSITAAAFGLLFSKDRSTVEFQSRSPSLYTVYFRELCLFTWSYFVICRAISEPKKAADRK